MKIDPYKHEEAFLGWRERAKGGIAGINKANSNIILQYLSDMASGLNIASKSVKGPRSYSRLNNLKDRIIFLAKQFESRVDASLLSVTEEQLFAFFNGMRDGTITKSNGERYQSAVDYVKTFKAFWHWHMKVNRRKGIDIRDITEDLDTSRTKPRWVYLTEEDVRRLCDKASYKLRVLIMFMYDTGIRSPTELINVRVSDLYGDFKKLHIRDETVKKGSFGRKINLMLCADMVRQYVADEGLQGDDQLFPIKPHVVNRYLQRLARRVLGDGMSPAGDTYSRLTMYDFRHCSCCYWLPRYKSESALKYRFGWRKSDKIHYYSEMLGMKDTITEEDMFVDTSKTKVEQQLVRSQQDNEMLREHIASHNSEVQELKALMQVYLGKLKQVESMRFAPMAA